MSAFPIAVLVGSLRRDSLNRRLAEAIARLAPSQLDLRPVAIGDLPLYDQDDDADPAREVARFKQEILAAAGLLFVTPEYNRSIPGVLKNAIDHGSRPYGKSVWRGKPAGIVGVSIGAVGTAVAQQHLRGVLAYLDVPTLGQPEIFLQAKDGLFGPGGEIGAGSRALLEQWMERYAAWISLNNQEKTADVF